MRRPTHESFFSKGRWCQEDVGGAEEDGGTSSARRTNGKFGCGTCVTECSEETIQGGTKPSCHPNARPWDASAELCKVKIDPPIQGNPQSMEEKQRQGSRRRA